MANDESSIMSDSDWVKGIVLSITAACVGGASKLAIRKSWIMIEHITSQHAVPLNLALLSQYNNVDDDSDICDSSTVLSSGTNGMEMTATLTSLALPLHDGDSNSSSLLSLEAEVVISENQKLQRRSRILRYSGIFGMSVLNPICAVWAMAYASPSVLVPFSGLTLVLVILLSEYFVGEKPLPVQICAAFLIITGEVTIVVWGDHTNEGNETIEGVFESYKDHYFISFLVALIFVILGLFYIMMGNGSPKLQRYAWGVAGGTLSGMQNFLKDALIVLKLIKFQQSQSKEVFYRCFLLLLVLGAISFAVSGLVILVTCMKRYDATYSASTYVGSFVLTGSIMSAIHYHTFANLESTLDLIMYPCGLFVLMIGIALIATMPVIGELTTIDELDICVEEVLSDFEKQIEFQKAENKKDGAYFLVPS